MEQLGSNISFTVLAPSYSVFSSFQTLPQTLKELGLEMIINDNDGEMIIKNLSL